MEPPRCCWLMVLVTALCAGLALSNNIHEFYCPYPEGQYANPDDCGSFYSCSQWKAELRKCDPQLHFNKLLGSCDWPQYANCQLGNSDYSLVARPAELNLASPVPGIACPNDVCHCQIPDPDDCSGFYKCVNGKAYKQRCSSGLSFNPDTAICDLKTNVKCVNRIANPSICVHPDGHGLHSHETDCTKFYHCSHGIPHLKDCPSALHFNPVLLVCDWPDRAGCGGPVTNITGVEGSCSCDCCILPDDCDCNKYYLCLNQKLYHKNCGKDLVYNPQIENCDHPRNVNRTCPGIPVTPVWPPITTTTTPPPPACKKIEGICNNPYREFYPHRDCGKFYHCDHGLACVKVCPANLHWSVARNRCEWPCIAKCDPAVPTCPTTTTTTTTTEKPECPEGDKLEPDPNNCERFFECCNGVRHHRWCPSGLHFNPSLKVCDWPNQAGCIDPPVTVEPTCEPEGYCNCQCCILPDEKDCSKFYLCLNYEKHHKSCGNGLLFNPKIKNCDHPDNVDCERNDTCKITGICKDRSREFYPHRDCGKFYHCVHGLACEKLCPPGLHWSVARNRCERPCTAKCNATIIICPPPPPVTTPVPNPCKDIAGICKDPRREFERHSDCGKFYHCTHGLACEKICPANLHWSTITNRCEYPCDAKCDKTLVGCPIPTEPPVTTPAPNPCRNIAGICTNPYREFYPHRNCRKFYHCAHGLACEKDCPANLHWSVALNRCEWPCIAKCDKTPPCPTPPPTQTPPPNPCNIAGICKDPNREFYPHPDCGKFYHCSHGVACIKRCPANLHWSVERNRCEWPCIAKCDTPTTCPGINETVTDTCSCKNCVLPDPSDCSTYYVCSGGKPTVKRCPYGQLYDRPSKSCKQSSEVYCPSVCEPIFCKTPNGLFPLPGQCKDYVHCINGVAYTKTCPVNQEFDPATSVCTWSNGRCGGKPIIDPVCPRPSGLFPDPKDCGWFIHCDHGKGYPKRCPTPLHFNARLQVCDWPWAAGCDGTSIVVPTDGPPVTPPVCDLTEGIVCPPCACRVPDYDNCNSFYQCTDTGDACKQRCPTGLYYNKKTNMCDLPQNARC